MFYLAIIVNKFDNVFCYMFIALVMLIKIVQVGNHNKMCAFVCHLSLIKDDR